MASFGSIDNQIHVANNSSETIYVFVAPNTDWLIADLVVGVASLAFSVGGVAKSVKTVKDLYNMTRTLTIMEKLKLVYKAYGIVSPISGAGSVIMKANDIANAKDFVRKNAVPIAPRNFQKVLDRTNLNPLDYFSPTGWAAVCGGSEKSLMIVNESFTKQAQFNTNSDWSWIVNDKAIVRSKYGTIWQEDPSAGAYWFGGDKIPNVGTSNRASAAGYQNRLYAAWKGYGSDEGIWFSSFDGFFWSAQQKIPNVGTSFGPDLAVFNNRLYAAWKGSGSDEGIYFASFDGQTWSKQQWISGVGTSIGPALAVFNNKLYAAWKGSGSDEGIYFASFDGQTWSKQQRISGVGTSIGPTLAVFKNRLYAIWKGSGSDQQVWMSSFDGNTWSSQKNVPYAYTSKQPKLVTFQELPYMLWTVADSGIACGMIELS